MTFRSAVKVINVASWIETISNRIKLNRVGTLLGKWSISFTKKKLKKDIICYFVGNI